MSTISKLRSSTNAQTTASESSDSRRGGRKEHDLSATPSLIRAEGHVCHEHDADSTRAKMDHRVWCTYHRMMMSSLLGCRTWRGATQYNGSIAHCQSRCHAAHASFTSTLKDDKLSRVKQTVSNGLPITPITDKYVKYRLAPTTPEKEDLKDSAKRDAVLTTLMSRLSIAAQQSSFHETPHAKQRDTTFENSYSANRLDCFLENRLRKIEDDLAALCTDQDLQPEEATENLLKGYIGLLKDVIPNLERRAKEFDHFMRAYQALKELPEDVDMVIFIKTAKDFILAKDALLDDLTGAPHMKKYIRYLSVKPFYHILSTMVKDADLDLATFKEMKSSLSLEITTDLQLKKYDIENRLKEAAVQLYKLEQILPTISEFRKLYFGICESGTRREPTRIELAEQLIQGMNRSVKSSEKF